MLNGIDFQLTANAMASRDTPYGEAQHAISSRESLAVARAEVASWPGYAPTPLIRLDGLAREIGVAEIRYKDEGPRFGLGSFKPLGGAYAVCCALADAVRERTGDAVSGVQLMAGRHHDIVRDLTVCAATDGNHGRSVAWGAGRFGCRCVIFVNQACSQGRVDAIAGFGAEVRRVAGSFDDAVREAAATGWREGWIAIPDTAAGGDTTAPLRVMQGYAVIAAELIEQMAGEAPPTHLFLQAGVGGMAAMVAARFWDEWGADRPTIVFAEPISAACWFASAAAGEPVALSGDVDSLMAGLSCGEVSRLAWDLIAPALDAVIAMPDDVVAPMMRLLAKAPSGDRPIVAGESAIAGLAGAILAAGDAKASGQLGLNGDSRIVVVGSEGDTDPDNYHRLVGISPNQVRQWIAEYEAK